MQFTNLQVILGTASVLDEESVYLKRENCKELIVSIKVFCVRLQIYKYLCYFFVEYYTSLV